jgi:hypothetical protein
MVRLVCAFAVIRGVQDGTMNHANVIQEGGCRCGQVRIKMTAAPFLTMACHCTGCQRMTGSAFSLSAAFPSKDFAITKGQPVVGGLHGATRHFFCVHCMSWMFTRPDGFDFVNVRATMLDDPSGFSPFIETYLSEKLPWASTPARYKFAKFPAAAEYTGLMQQYANGLKIPD